MVGDFYEEDEPVEKIRALFAALPKVLTAAPRVVGWHCPHFSMTTGGIASLPTAPTNSLCSCAMTPTYA